MNKADVAKIFEEIAVLLELKNENPFKIRAYQNAARAILNLDEDLKKIIKEERLTDLEGIGKDLALKITTLVNTGHLPFYEELKKATPPILIELMQIQGLGPKKIINLYEHLGIQSIEELKQACLNDKLSDLKGFGAKTQKNILDALEHREIYHKRHLWWDAIAIADPLVASLRKLKGVTQAEIAGSLRRKLETVGDLDLVVAAENPKPIMKWFTSQPIVEVILAHGDTKSSVRLHGGIQADLRIVPEQQFGFALCYFTGSKDHDIRMRHMARTKGWTLSEWGLVSEDPAKPGPFDKRKKSVTEEEIYASLGLAYIPPELRENTVEFEAAAKGRLPVLVEETDLRGAFHVHTTASDGRSTLEEMAAEAQRLGWDYIGISDHSKASFQANGLSEERLKTQIQQIKALNASEKYSTHVFAGTECDILSDGSLDFPDSLLKQLDFVIVSVHSSLQQDEKTMTKRLIRAIEHPCTTMVGHITGRLLLSREPYKVNLPKVIDACIANGKIIELNANPYRLDMDWRHWHAAADKGLMCCINPDAHHASHLAFVRAGVNSARKGWLQKKNILNTMTLKQVAKVLGRK